MTRGSAAAAAAVALTLGAPKLALAQVRRWERHVRDQVAQAVASLRAQGFTRTVVTHTGALNNEESQSFDVTLEHGRPFALVGVCDADCSGLHLVLSTATGSDVASDLASGAVPIVRLTPRETSRYRVKVVMAACRMSPCWYSVAVVRGTSGGP